MDGPHSLAQLCHRRWSIPIVAELDRNHGAKFITLVNRLDAAQGSVRQTLDDLIQSGLVMPNPGYGHPMRPEYILTDRGHAIAEACIAIDSTVKKMNLQGMAYRKWSLPVLSAIGRGSSRFNEISDRLGSITDRALAMSLKDLGSVTLVDRVVADGHPPRVVYNPTRRGQRLVPLLEEL